MQVSRFRVSYTLIVREGFKRQRRRFSVTVQGDHLPNLKRQLQGQGAQQLSVKRIQPTFLGC